MVLWERREVFKNKVGNEINHKLGGYFFPYPCVSVVVYVDVCV